MACLAIWLSVRHGKQILVSEMTSQKDISFVLRRRVKVQCWNVTGEVSQKERRPELCSLLLRIKEKGDTTAEDIAEHMLFDRTGRRGVAERLLMIAQRHGLIDRQGGGGSQKFILNDRGWEAIRSGDVFVPEQGEWKIWVSDDQLLDVPVLALQPVRDEPNIREEVGSQEKREQARLRPIRSIDAFIRAAEGVVFTDVVTGVSHRIDSLGSRGENRSSDENGLDLDLTWAFPDNRVHMEGTYRSSKSTPKMGGGKVGEISRRLGSPDISAGAVWKCLLQSEGLWQRWDETCEVMRVGFAETSDSERGAMNRSIWFKRPCVAAYGEFDQVEVHGVPLRASTQKDADDWAEWRLRHQVDQYATQERYDKWRETAEEPLRDFRVSLPERKALAERVWSDCDGKPGADAWYLMAAVDWSL